MWHLIPTILYLTYGEATHHHPETYQIALNNQRPNRYLGGSYPYVGRSPTQVNDYQLLRPPQYVNTPYTVMLSPQGYSRNGKKLRQSESQHQLRATTIGSDPLYLDYGLSDSRRLEDEQSYFTDLELVENFGNYMKQRTLLEGSSSAINDASHQYNALCAVLFALAKVIRNSCTTDFDEVYDQVYQSTVDQYYKYGLENAEKVAAMVEKDIRKADLHIRKLKKLKQEYCEKETFCSAMDDILKSTPLLFVKELETLEAVAHFARSYYTYIDEFDEAAHKGNVYSYLQNGKDRLREYVMHIVNTMDHITNKAVKCP